MKKEFKNIIMLLIVAILTLGINTDLSAQLGKSKEKIGKGKAKGALNKGKDKKAELETTVENVKDEINEKVDGIRGKGKLDKAQEEVQPQDGVQPQDEVHGQGGDHAQDGDHNDGPKGKDIANEAKSKGKAYGKDKGEISGKEFGQVRAEAASSTHVEKKQKVEKSCEEGGVALKDCKNKVKDAREKLEKDKKDNKISDEAYQTKKAKIDQVELKGKVLESKLAKTQGLLKEQ